MMKLSLIWLQTHHDSILITAKMRLIVSQSCPKREPSGAKYCSFYEAKFRNTLLINNIRKSPEYSHICKPLGVC